MATKRTPSRSGGREDIDDEGYEEPLMVRNMSCCAKEVWDLRGSLDMVDQYSAYYLREMPKVEQTTYEENESEHNRLGSIEATVRLQWDRVMDRLGNARDWCYMPELPEDQQFLTGDSENPSFYTISEINNSIEELKKLMDAAFGRGILRRNC